MNIDVIFLCTLLSRLMYINIITTGTEWFTKHAHSYFFLN